MFMISPYSFADLEEWEKALCLLISVVLFVVFTASITWVLCRCRWVEKKVVPSRQSVQAQLQHRPSPPTNVCAPDATVLGGVSRSVFTQLKSYTFIDPVGRVSSAVARLAAAPISILTNPAPISGRLPSTIEGLLGNNNFSPWDPFLPQGPDLSARLSCAARQLLDHVAEENQGKILTSAEGGTLCIVADPELFQQGVSRFGYSTHTPVVPAQHIAATAWATALYEWIGPLRQPGCILEGARIRVLLPGPEFECHFINAWCNFALFGNPEMVGVLEAKCVPELFVAAQPSYSALIPLRH